MGCERLRELRETTGLSLRRTARLSGVSAARLSQLELSGKPIPGALALRLVPHLGLGVLDVASFSQLIEELVRRRVQVAEGHGGALRATDSR